MEKATYQKSRRAKCDRVRLSCMTSSSGSSTSSSGICCCKQYLTNQIRSMGTNFELRIYLEGSSILIIYILYIYILYMLRVLLVDEILHIYMIFIWSIGRFLHYLQDMYIPDGAGFPRSTVSMDIDIGKNTGLAP